MKLITIFATLTQKGISFTEKEEDAVLKGKNTYTTDKGTRYTTLTLMVAKPTIVNSIPSLSQKPRIGFKITFPQEDYEQAKKVLMKTFKMHLVKAELNLVDLQHGYNTAIDTQTIIEKTDDGKRKRRG